MKALSKSEWVLTSGIALGIFLLHVGVNATGAYGFFRDELYYLACSDHLAWGYVDQPPFSLFVLKVSRMLFGDSLVAVRLIPAFLHAGVIFFTARITKEMGGNRMAILLSCLAMATAPVLVAMMSFYSMNAIDIFIWTLVFFFMLKIQKENKTINWIALGIVLGIGLLNKISVLFLGAGIFVSLLITSREVFKTKGPYITGLIAFALFLPYVVWNAANEWAHLEFIHNASSGKYSGRSPLDFAAEQFLNMNPIAVPLWLGGLLALFFYKPLQAYKSFAWIYITAFVILVLNRTSKGEYLSPAYVGLFAAGAVWLEAQVTLLMKWVKGIYLFVFVTSFLLLMPLVMPILPVEKYISYAASLGFAPSSSENKELGELPQFYADMFGWEEKTRDVAEVYNSLSEEDKKVCAIFSNNYGRCGAIDFFGQQYGLPKSIGNHNNYWIWGPRDYTGEIIIILGGKLEDHREGFESVELAKTSVCQYCMPYEKNVSIFIARKLKVSPKDIWQEEKHYE